MNLDVAFLPAHLEPQSLAGRSVVVFDVLRATTTMTAALAAGVSEIQIFGDVDAVRQAARSWPPGRVGPLLCGEQQCLAPEGFDLGNSPGAFGASLAGRTLYMSTTNGTRALLAARDARLLLVGALVNAAAVARELSSAGHDVTLLCAGTNGRVAIEDVIGAGAVLDALAGLTDVRHDSDAPAIAVELFRSARADLRAALAKGAGGQNVIRAQLGPDIDFAAALNRYSDVVGCFEGGVVRKLPAR